MNNDQMILDLIRQHGDLRQQHRENESAQRAARNSLPEEMQWGLKFPDHLDFFYSDCAVWDRKSKTHLNREQVEAFNAEVYKRANPSEEERQSHREALPMIDWDAVFAKADAAIPKYAAIAESSQKRLDWVDEQERYREQANQRVGIHAFEKISEDLFSKMICVEEKICAVQPDSIEGLKAKANFMREWFDIMDDDSNNCQSRFVVSLVSNIAALSEVAHA